MKHKPTDKFEYDSKKKVFKRTLKEMHEVNIEGEVIAVGTTTTEQEYDKASLKKVVKFLKKQKQELQATKADVQKKAREIKNAKETKEVKAYYKLIDRLNKYRQKEGFTDLLGALKNKNQVQAHLEQLDNQLGQVNGQLLMAEAALKSVE